jgi:hypothetical protein
MNPVESTNSRAINAHYDSMIRVVRIKTVGKIIAVWIAAFASMYLIVKYL